MLNTHFLTSVAVPVCVLAALALVLPLFITPRDTRSQRRLAMSVILSAVILVVIGAVFIGGLYAREGIRFSHMLAQSPLFAVMFFVKRSLMAALVWGPVLALAWFNMAQKIEHLKGKDGSRIGLKTTSVEAPEPSPDTPE
ncbi:MAG: putative membrane protein [Celeribacter sp.]|jgi:hypothetical protein